MPTAELAFGHVTEACHALRHMLSPPSRRARIEIPTATTLMCPPEPPNSHYGDRAAPNTGRHRASPARFRPELLSDSGGGEFAAGINERCDGRIAPQFHRKRQILDLPWPRHKALGPESSGFRHDRHREWLYRAPALFLCFTAVPSQVGPGVRIRPIAFWRRDQPVRGNSPSHLEPGRRRADWRQTETCLPAQPRSAFDSTADASVISSL
jgi:hypothetical protein